MSLASLHAGLIERSRQQPEPNGIAKLRAAVAPPPKVSGPVQLPQTQKLKARPLMASPPPRRYGLTVRVDQNLRGELARYTEHTGRTMQNVLHAALSGYLDRVNVNLKDQGSQGRD